MIYFNGVLLPYNRLLKLIFSRHNNGLGTSWFGKATLVFMR